MHALLQCGLGVVLLLFVMTPAAEAHHWLRGRPSSMEGDMHEGESAQVQFQAQSRDNKCTVSYEYWGIEVYKVYTRQRYTVSCGWCGTQRCTRYRQAPQNAYRRRLWTSYRRECCKGWRQDRFGKCSIPICSPTCHPTRGRCVQPNQCRCNSGFTGTTCSQDINECQIGSGAPSCDQVCINTIGSYRCECCAGYNLDADRHGCTDIDECTMARTNDCQQICTNLPGDYACTCYDGYNLNDDKKTCADDNDCLRRNGCEQVCINRPGAPLVCGCWKGFELDTQQGYSCSDIDECELGQHDCDQNCHNNVGNYTCSCNEGYKLGMDGKNCFDVDECAPPSMNCEMVEVCDIYNCTYVKGFKIDTSDCDPGSGISSSSSTSSSSTDLDDCSRQDYNCSDLQVCQQKSDDDLLCVCIETSGNKLSDIITTSIQEPRRGDVVSVDNFPPTVSTLTGCLDQSGGIECQEFRLSDLGLELRIDGQFCEDEITHDCNSMQACRNTIGGYECPCIEGYTMDNVTGDCYDIDECSTDYMNCPKQLPVQICTGPDGNITCECVEEGEVTICTGDDGCVLNCKGLQVCGKASCNCHSGYFLNSDNKPCEGGGCGEMIHDCTEMEYCNNTVGSYECHCIEGYERDEETGVCRDVDECREKTSKCYHLCMNLVGNYSCACVEGYTLGEDGYSCSMPMGLFEAYVALKDEDGLNDAYDVVLDSGSEWYLFPLGILVGLACWIFVVIGRKKSERFKKATDVPVNAVKNLQGRVVEQATAVRGRYSVRGGGNQSNVYMARPTKMERQGGPCTSDDAAAVAAQEPGEDATIYSPSVVVAEVRRTSKYQTPRPAGTPDEDDVYQM